MGHVGSGTPQDVPYPSRNELASGSPPIATNFAPADFASLTTRASKASIGSSLALTQCKPRLAANLAGPGWQKRNGSIPKTMIKFACASRKRSTATQPRIGKPVPSGIGQSRRYNSCPCRSWGRRRKIEKEKTSRNLDKVICAAPCMLCSR